MPNYTNTATTPEVQGKYILVLSSFFRGGESESESKSESANEVK